jgi:hypothetical protein
LEVSVAKKVALRIGMAALSVVVASQSFSLADDWRIFRKDAERSAASTDKIALPITPLWTWQSQRVQGIPALSTVVVRGDYAYFTSGPRAGSKEKPTGRLLVCVDVKTGAVAWTQKLDTARLHGVLPEDIGPSVSDQGIVFAVDLTTIYRPCPSPTFIVKAFAPDGTLFDSETVPVKNEMSRTFLRSGDGEVDYTLTATTKPAT